MRPGDDGDVRDDLAPDFALHVVVVAYGRRGAQPRVHGQARREEVTRFDLAAIGVVGQRVDMTLASWLAWYPQRASDTTPSSKLPQMTGFTELTDFNFMASTSSIINGCICPQGPPLVS